MKEAGIKQNILNSLSGEEQVDITALTELMGIYYRTHYPIFPEQFENEYTVLSAIIKGLSKKRGNRLRRLIAEICDEYRHKAFLEGLRVGALLILELYEEKSD